MKKSILRKIDILQLFFIYTVFLSFNSLVILSKNITLKEEEKNFFSSLFLPFYEFKIIILIFTIVPFLMWIYHIMDKTSKERRIRVIIGDTKFNIFFRMFINVLEISLLSSTVIVILLNVFFENQNLTLLVTTIIKLNFLPVVIECMIFFYSMKEKV